MVKDEDDGGYKVYLGTEQKEASKSGTEGYSSGHF